MSRRPSSPAALPTTTTSTSTSISTPDSDDTTPTTMASETPTKAVAASSQNGDTSKPEVFVPTASFRLLLLACMVIQNSTVVLVGRHTRSGVPKNEMFVVSHVILVSEFMKLVGSCILEAYATNWNLGRSMKENVFDSPLDTLRISVPALLYLFQNSILYVALTNLSAPLFQVTYQSKLLTTAIMSVIMLNRKYTFQQWVCLFTLGIGVAIVVLGESGGKDDGEAADDAAKAVDGADGGADDGAVKQNIVTGLLAVTAACLSSAFAGVYFEMVLKKPTGAGEKARRPVSLWMRNIQLSFFSVAIALVQGAYQRSRDGDGDDGGDAAKPFMHGFNFWVWVLVTFQAGGGLLIAAIIKYADNVLKGLATGVSVATSTFCSMILFGTPLTIQFTIGAGIILSSVYFFSNGGGPSKAKSVVDAPGEPTTAEMKPMVLPK